MKGEIKNSENIVEHTINGIYYINTMKTYCVSCKENTANENSSVTKTKQNREMLLLNCAICGKKKSVFNKNQEASRLELVFKN